MAGREEYLLGMADAEIRRLERQHQAWRAVTDRIWDVAGIGAGSTVVELGCGPGYATVDLARRVGPEGRVVGIDASARAVAVLRERAARYGLDNVEVATGEVTEVDVSPWAPDAVVARWLFCYLPGPEALVARIARQMAPGSRLAVLDYWNYQAVHAEPATALFRAVFRAVEASFAAAGGSLQVGGRLPAWLERHGVAVERVELLGGIARPGEPLWRWVAEFLELYLPSLVAKGALSAGDLAAHRAEWAERERTPGAILHLPPVVGVVGTRRGG